MESTTERRPEASGAEPGRPESPRNSPRPEPAPEPALDELCELAALACAAPAALIHVVEGERSAVRARFGLGWAEAVRAGPQLTRSASLRPEPEARAERQEPVGEYLAHAGVAFGGEAGLAGAVSVLDLKAREFTPAQLRALRLVASRVEGLLRARAPGPAPAPAESPGELVLQADAEWRICRASPGAAALLTRDGAPLEGAHLWSKLPWPAPAPGAGWAGSACAPLRLGGATYRACLHPAPGGWALYLRRDEEAQRAEEAQRTSSLLHGLLQGYPDPVYAKDLEGRYAYVNEAAARCLGRPAAELLGRSDAQLFPQGERPATSQHDQQVLRDGRTRTFEDLDPQPEQRRTWLATKGLVRDAQGRALGLFGILRDISRRKATEASLQVSEERLRLALDVARLGLWDWSVHSHELRWSLAEERLFGLPTGAVEGSHRAFLELLHPDDRERVEAAFAQAVAEAREFSVEFRLRPHGGPPRWLLGWGRPLRNADGEVVRLLGVVGDITPRKEEEERAQRVAHFQEQLLGIVGHDLRSPLAAIRIWAQLLGRGDLPAERWPKAADAILRSTSRMDRMITDLLDFNRSRLGSGIPVVARASDIHQICGQVVEELRAAYGNRRLALRVEGPGKGRWDADRLTQVVSNLVTNALEYSPPDSEVQVGSAGEDDGVVVEVRNQGRPIPKELLSIIFEPYRRGAETDHAGTRNLGLGLYIARQVVEAHGGHIAVASDEAGTVFTVRLPRAPPRRGPEAAA